MFANLSALFIDEQKARTDTLRSALGPEIFFIDATHSASLPDGLNQLLQNAVQICFISDTFPTDQLQSFLRDIKQIPEMKKCVVTLVKESVPDNTIRDARSGEGIHSIISQQATAEDKQALNLALESVVVKAKMIEEKARDVSEVLENLIGQVDGVAMDRKRGVDAKFNAIVPRFIKETTALDTEILDSYYDELSETLEEVQSPPEGFESIEVPDRLLTGKFPKLNKNSYSGSSRRLWKKLSDRWSAKSAPKKDPE